MRPLLIDGHAKAQVQRVLDWAMPPERWYRPGKSKCVPGDDFHFVANLSSYRCVFTISEFPDGLVARHLSISVPSEDYPNPFAAFTIAELFGFSGWDGKSQRPPESWMLNINRAEHCVVLAQPYENARVTA